MLLWHLAGDTNARFPGGLGGAADTPSLESAPRLSTHQQAASIIAEDASINRWNQQFLLA